MLSSNNFLRLKCCGTIEDIGLGLRWDTATLANEVERRAAALSRMDIGRGSVVAIGHSGTAHFFADLFAVWAVGSAAVCLDPTLTDTELQTVVGFAKPAALLADRSAVSPKLSIPVLELAAATSGHRSASASIPDLDDPALVLFTSGTTAAPKGVVLSFRALKIRIELNAAVIPNAALKRTLVTLPTHFGHGLIGNALTPLMNGADIVLYPSGIPLAESLGRIIDEHRISFLTSVPILWKIARTSSEPPSKGSLVRIHVGSAPLSAKLWSEITAWSRAEVVNCYGMTETANWMAGASSISDGVAEGLVGRPWGGVAAIIDENGMIQSQGSGEVIVQTPCLMSGYLDRPDLTTAAMWDGWFRTGDRGTVDEFGRIWLTGRIKDEINRAGFKVQPAEIDLLLETHPAISEACVFAAHDSISGEAVCAAIRLVAGANADVASLQSWCRERLRKEAIPERWFFVDRIPRNLRGKVNRDAVRQAVVNATTEAETGRDALADPCTTQSDEEGKSPGGQESPTKADLSARVRKAVEQAWAAILNRQSLQADVGWAAAGGDSIGALHLWLRIEEQLSTKLPLSFLKLSMTPNELVHTIEGIVESANGHSFTNDPRQQQPLVFIMPPAYGDVPALAQFRSSLEDRIRFHVIQYPQLKEMVDSGGGFNRIVNAAVDQISAVCGDGACLLAGYSFGGFVAWEAARVLIERGRRVGFLGLIDSRLKNPPKAQRSFLTKASGFVGRTWSQPKQAYRDSVWWISELLVHASPLSLLRRFDHLVSRIPASELIAFRLEILTRLRSRALQRYPINPVDVTTTLFRSDEYLIELPDHGWSSVCKRLTVIPVDGGHRSLLEPQYRQRLCNQFLEAVDAATSPKPN